MAREGFLYYGALPTLADEAPNVEVTFAPVILRFAGHGCAQVELLIHPRIKDTADACCAPPSAPELWATYRIDGCRQVLCEKHNQMVLTIPGTYRVRVCHGDLDTVVYWEESEALANRALLPVATSH